MLVTNENQIQVWWLIISDLKWSGLSNQNVCDESEVFSTDRVPELWSKIKLIIHSESREFSEQQIPFNVGTSELAWLCYKQVMKAGFLRKSLRFEQVDLCSWFLFCFAVCSYCFRYCYDFKKCPFVCTFWECASEDTVSLQPGQNSLSEVEMFLRF